MILHHYAHSVMSTVISYPCPRSKAAIHDYLNPIWFCPVTSDKFSPTNVCISTGNCFLPSICHTDISRGCQLVFHQIWAPNHHLGKDFANVLIPFPGPVLRHTLATQNTATQQCPSGFSTWTIPPRLWLLLSAFL